MVGEVVDVAVVGEGCGGRIARLGFVQLRSWRGGDSGAMSSVRDSVRGSGRGRGVRNRRLLKLRDAGVGGVEGAFELGRASVELLRDALRRGEEFGGPRIRSRRRRAQRGVGFDGSGWVGAERTPASTPGALPSGPTQQGDARGDGDGGEEGLRGEHARRGIARGRPRGRAEDLIGDRFALAGCGQGMLQRRGVGGRDGRGSEGRVGLRQRHAWQDGWGRGISRRGGVGDFGSVIADTSVSFLARVGGGMVPGHDFARCTAAVSTIVPWAVLA